MIQARIAPCRSIAGSTMARTLARTAASDQQPSATKCRRAWCCAPTRSGAVSAAIGSTLLRSHGKQQPATVVAQRSDPSRVPDHAGEPIEIARKTLRAAAPSQVRPCRPPCKKESLKSLIPAGKGPWQSDSVRLARSITSSARASSDDGTMRTCVRRDQFAEVFGSQSQPPAL